MSRYEAPGLPPWFRRFFFVLDDVIACDNILNNQHETHEMPDESAPLVLRNFGGHKIDITTGAYALRSQAVHAAQAIHRVQFPEEQLVAVDALRKLKELRQGMEATRKAVKAPVLALGRLIDNTAAEFLEEVTKQEGRLQGMINHFQRKQLEAHRVETEKLSAKETLADELEIKAQELRHNAVFVTDPVQRQELFREAYELERSAVDARMTAELAVSPLVPKAKGLVVRQRINFKVTDAIVFCQAYPQFWKWHEETETLKLDRMRVLDELNNEKGLFRRTRFPEELSQTEDGRLVRPAGLEVFEETKAHVR